MKQWFKDVYFHICKMKTTGNDLYVLWPTLGGSPRVWGKEGLFLSQQNTTLKETLKNGSLD